MPEDVANSAKLLSALRPGLCVVVQPMGTKSLTWSLNSPASNIQLDCTAMEKMYLGRTKLGQEETAGKWNEIIAHRRANLFDVGGSKMNMGDGGSLQAELNTAMAAVHRASFMSRSLQKNFQSISKDDKSPVTIADFAVQALVIDKLRATFPTDRFIAEEDSSILQEDAGIRQGVLDALQAATSERWTDQRLFETVDAGAFSGAAERVWVLDPVDGTKGFIRGEHYCIALALLVKGQSQLAVLGCPNVNLSNVLQPKRTAAGGSNIAAIDASASIPGPAGSPSTTFFPVSSGSVFYSVSGRGAWARSLAMPLGAGYEVQVSSVEGPQDVALCESAEASHGDRAVTKAVFKSLGLMRDYVRLDGQCKYCIVGSGAAEGNMRLPPAGYREKIWDHAPGVHFIIEAGGKVTDLEGKGLDFGNGRFLSEHVTGILATNQVLHGEILSAIVQAKQATSRDTAGRLFGQ